MQDLKPENVLLLEDGGVKVCDMGALVKVDATGIPIDAESFVGSFTPEYTAPEVLAGVSALSLRPASVFALGAVARALLGDKKASPALASLLDAMTQPLPFNRPSIHRVMQHAWFHQ